MYPSDILVPSSPFPRCCEESKICAMLLEMATHVNSEKIVKLHKTATQSIRWMDGPRRINGWRWLEERKDLGSTTPCQPITTARYHISLWWTRYYQRRGSTTPSSVQTAKPIPTKKSDAVHLKTPTYVLLCKLYYLAGCFVLPLSRAIPAAFGAHANHQ